MGLVTAWHARMLADQGLIAGDAQLGASLSSSGALASLFSTASQLWSSAKTWRSALKATPKSACVGTSRTSLCSSAARNGEQSRQLVHAASMSLHVFASKPGGVYVRASPGGASGVGTGHVHCAIHAVCDPDACMRALPPPINVEVRRRSGSVHPEWTTAALTALPGGMTPSNTSGSVGRKLHPSCISAPAAPNCPVPIRFACGGRLSFGRAMAVALTSATSSGNACNWRQRIQAMYVPLHTRRPASVLVIMLLCRCVTDGDADSRDVPSLSLIHISRG